MREIAISTAFDDWVAPDLYSPERNLMRSILHSAFADLNRGVNERRDAVRYLLDDSEYYLYSFRSICAHLGLCPTTIRRHFGLIREVHEARMAA
ncbi:hypothetical protein JNK13_09250 [bacterium]|nr:hypothetical protein [bacterium]